MHRVDLHSQQSHKQQHGRINAVRFRLLFQNSSTQLGDEQPSRRARTLDYAIKVLAHHTLRKVVHY